MIDIDLIPIIPSPPKNESQEHFYLKQVAKIYLKTQKGCQFVGSEIFMRNGRYNGRDKRKIADTVGVKKVKAGKEYNYETYCIEVKVSTPDFRTGFNSGGTYNWIIAPKGVIPIRDLPEDVGLIEVGLNEFTWEQNKRIHRLSGLYETKSPRRKRLSNKVGLDSLENICKKLTIRDVYKNPWIQPRVVNPKKEVRK